MCGCMCVYVQAKKLLGIMCESKFQKTSWYTRFSFAFSFLVFVYFRLVFCHAYLSCSCTRFLLLSSWIHKCLPILSCFTCDLFSCVCVCVCVCDFLSTLATHMHHFLENNQAPPFREAEFDIEFGRGISRVSEVVDLGAHYNVLTKAGVCNEKNDVCDVGVPAGVFVCFFFSLPLSHSLSLALPPSLSHTLSLSLSLSSLLLCSLSLSITFISVFRSSFALQAPGSATKISSWVKGVRKPNNTLWIIPTFNVKSNNKSESQ